MSVEQIVGGCVTQAGEQASNVTRTAWLSQGLPDEIGRHDRRLPVRFGPAGQQLHRQPGVRRRHPLRHRLRRRGHEPGRPRGQRLQRPGQVPPDDFPWDMPDQFNVAERIAQKYGITREDVDWLGLESQRKAAVAVAEGRFDREIVPIEAPGDGRRRPHRRTHSRQPDQGPRETTAEGLAGLKPVLPDGMHTAGNSSQISDGAAAVLWMSQERAGESGCSPRARIVAQTLVGSDPDHHLDGPIAATAEVLKKAGMTMADIDIFEVNEAFASVVMSWGKVHEVDWDKVNVNGGPSPSATRWGPRAPDSSPPPSTSSSAPTRTWRW